jgi:hypothetical protein
MATPWQTRLLDELERIDEEEAPHGLYGIRDAHRQVNRLPTYAQLFSSTRTLNLAHRCGFGNGNTSWDDRMRFAVPGMVGVWLEFRDYATTKVQKFGSKDRLDKMEHRDGANCLQDLENSIPKLYRSVRLGRRHGACSYGLLLVAHSPDERGLGRLLGGTIEERFLIRYGLRNWFRQWPDRHGRDFTTALSLWSASTPHANTSPGNGSGNDE